MLVHLTGGFSLSHYQSYRWSSCRGIGRVHSGHQIVRFFISLIHAVSGLSLGVEPFHIIKSIIWTLSQ